jgi:hypothetical protein
MPDLASRAASIFHQLAQWLEFQTRPPTVEGALYLIQRKHKRLVAMEE